MDESLQQIFRIRPLQETVIAYRNNTQTYRRIMKEVCIKELKSLVNVEMDIVQTDLKMPDTRKVPPINKTQPIKIQFELDEILKDHEITMKALEILSTTHKNYRFN